MDKLEKIPIIIEIPKGCKFKYEIDKVSGSLVVDRILKLSYPFNYGYMPNTLWEDGDALDAIVIGDFELYPKSIVYAEPVAVIKMFDNGESDFKLICRVGNDVFEEYWDAIEGFLKVYKKGVTIEGYDTKKTTIQKTIKKAKDAYVHHP